MGAIDDLELVMASQKVVVDDASVKSGYAFGPARPYLSMDIQRGTAKVSTICQRIGRYVLIDAVGRGAMGIVYRAEDPSIHRTVAVKVLHPNKGMTPQQIHIARERFRREAQTAGSIDHPNIVRIFDVGEDAESGDMYIVMEYLSGPSLEQMLKDAALPLPRAAEIIRQIASGLDTAHARGIIHRDIKPSNILLSEEGTAKLADFGITQVGSSSLTQDMTMLGTPAYMSPEQVNGKRLDPRADLFSLGVVSYEMLAGKKPFEGSDAVSIAYAIVHAQPAPISEVNPELPQALDGVLERVLAKDPTKRFATGREFHEALLSCLSRGDVPRSSTLANVSTRRKHLLSVLAGLVALAAMVALMFLRGAPTVPTAGKPTSSAADKTTTAAKPPSRTAAKTTTAARPVVPAASVTISLTHRLRNGTLVVSLDGKPIFTEKFSKAKLALRQTTTWDAFDAPSGAHTLRARVHGEDGRTYLSDAQPIELPRAKGTAIRIGFKGDRLTVKQTSG
jgi:serine/threonine protein kinase